MIFLLIPRNIAYAFDIVSLNNLRANQYFKRRGGWCSSKAVECICGGGGVPGLNTDLIANFCLKGLA
jgi:hypothetical protein